MFLLQTKKLDFVSPIKTDDYTYGNAIVEAMVKELTDYGFTDTVNGTIHILSWNGKPRFVLQGQANTSGVSFRVALPYLNDSWGSNYTYATVNSISSDSSNVRLKVSIFFFASEDVVFFGFAPPGNSSPAASLVSLPCKTLDGDEGIVGIRNFVNQAPLIVPCAETSMSNDYPFEWDVAYKSYNMEKPNECYIKQRCVLFQSNIVKYIVEDFAEIKAHNSFVLGQVITVDGQKYVNISDCYFAKLTPTV